MSSTSRVSLDSGEIEKQLEAPALNSSQDAEKATPTPNPVTVLDWDGPDDPDDPHNWHPWIRHYHIVPPALISFAA